MRCELCDKELGDEWETCAACGKTVCHECLKDEGLGYC
jgi:hypothetical protein